MPISGLRGEDPPDRLDAVEPGERQVHQDHLCRRDVAPADGLGSVLGLAHHLDAGGVRQEGTNTGSDHRVIVHDENSDRICRDRLALLSMKLAEFLPQMARQSFLTSSNQRSSVPPPGGLIVSLTSISTGR